MGAGPRSGRLLAVAAVLLAAAARAAGEHRQQRTPAASWLAAVSCTLRRLSLSEPHSMPAPFSHGRSSCTVHAWLATCLAACPPRNPSPTPCGDHRRFHLIPTPGGPPAACPPAHLVKKYLAPALPLQCPALQASTTSASTTITPVMVRPQPPAPAGRLRVGAGHVMAARSDGACCSAQHALPPGLRSACWIRPPNAVMGMLLHLAHQHR